MSTSAQTWNAASYDTTHGFVSAYGTDVVTLLAPRPGERILDLGCGTGQLARRIADAGASVVGIDVSEAMIARAREQFPELDFSIQDARDFHFEQPFDAVFSNAVLHWVSGQDQAAACVAAALRPGGRFVAELGGHGNVRAILDATYAALERASYPLSREAEPFFFPSIAVQAAVLERAGLEARQAVLFDRPTPLAGGEAGLTEWLETFSVWQFAHVPAGAKAAIYQDIEDALRPLLYHDGTWVADYRRLRFVAVKESK
jgi:SAM-dependent methyltransferase